jgi:subtilisin-like proprotein convertase family protein
LVLVHQAPANYNQSVKFNDEANMECIWAAVKRQAVLFRSRITLAILLSLLSGVALAQGAPGKPEPGDTSDPASDGTTLTAPPELLPADRGALLPRYRAAAGVTQPAAAYQPFVIESEPNNNPATATPIANFDRVRANIYPVADVDYYAFSAQAGDRAYAAVMTAGSSSWYVDSVLHLLDGDGATLIESDNDGGTFASQSSSIAGAVLPSDGMYYLKVTYFANANTLRPYHLYLRVQSGSPAAESEPNDTAAQAAPLAAGGWMAGAGDPAVAGELDWYSLSLAAGDTVFLSLDLDPERDAVSWNGRVCLGLFGNASDQLVCADDAGAGDTQPSEALFMTVKEAGAYYAVVDSGTAVEVPPTPIPNPPGAYYVGVDSARAAVGGSTATYHLSATVYPAVAEGVSCTTYTSTDVPQVIPTGPGMVSSSLTVPSHPRIADLDVILQLEHTFMANLDVHLRSPQGNDNGLFTDIGSTVVGPQTQMDTVFDDEAGVPPFSEVLKGLAFNTQLFYRLAWFDGEDAGGVWTLDIRDDRATDGGTLTGWGLRICEPPPEPACPVGYAAITVFSTDFESGDAGFTHSGVRDEWSLGLPVAAPITTCNSGSNCWKTDLLGTYNASASQELRSPDIDLAGLNAPIVVRWAQRYQMETATYDHAYVDLQQAGGGAAARLWDWLDATMADYVGNPPATVQESAGWGLHTARADNLAGLNTALVFHLDSDSTVQYGGLAIDDVSVQGCAQLLPQANAGPDQTVDTGAAVQLDGAASSSPSGFTPLAYLWAQTGGPAATLSDPTAAGPTFTAPSDPGELTFTLVVTDSLGMADPTPDAVVITVANQAPQANAGPDQSVTTTSLVTLNGSGSADPDNDLPLTYQWTQTGGPAVTLSDPTLAGPTFTAPGDPGELTFTLVVTDSLGLADPTPDVVVITVANQAPVADAGLDQSVKTTSLVTLHGSGSADPDNDLPLTYQWTQTGGPAVMLSDPTAAGPTFTAPGDPGALTFTLVVTDSLGLADPTPDGMVVTVSFNTLYLPFVGK